MATIGRGPPGYTELGRALDDFEVVYGYPWSGEEALMCDLMRSRGHSDARLILHSAENSVRIYRRGVEVGAETMAGPNALPAV